MPKFKVVLVMTNYQEIIFEAEDMDEADTKAYGLWDEDAPINIETAAVDIYELNEVKE